MITQVKFWNKATNKYDLAVLPIVVPGERLGFIVGYKNTLSVSHQMSLLFRFTYTDNSEWIDHITTVGMLEPGEDTGSYPYEANYYTQKTAKKLYIAIWADGTLLDWKEFVAGAAPPPPPPPTPPPAAEGVSWLMPVVIGGAIVGLVLLSKRRKK